MSLIETQIKTFENNKKIQEYIKNIDKAEIENYIILIRNGKFKEYIENEYICIRDNIYKVNGINKQSLINYFYNLFQYLNYISIIFLSIKNHQNILSNENNEVFQENLDFLYNFDIRKFERRLYILLLTNVKIQDIKSNYINFSVSSDILNKYGMNFKNFYIISGEINNINKERIEKYNLNDYKMFSKCENKEFIIHTEIIEDNSYKVCSIQ